MEFVRRSPTAAPIYLPTGLVLAKAAFPNSAPKQAFIIQAKRGSVVFASRDR